MSAETPSQMPDRCSPDGGTPHFPKEVLTLDEGRTSYLSAEQVVRLGLDAATPLAAEPSTPVATPKSAQGTPPTTPVATPKSAQGTPPATPVATPKSAQGTTPATLVGTPKGAQGTPPATPVGTPKPKY